MFIGIWGGVFFYRIILDNSLYFDIKFKISYCNLRVSCCVEFENFRVFILKFIGFFRILNN